MRLWFYVPDYVLVRDQLEEAYTKHGVEEWSAEPGCVRGREDDADITVEGSLEKIYSFAGWLRQSGIKGLRIDGEKVK